MITIMRHLFTCNLPSNVRGIVTQIVLCAPLVVIAVIKASNSGAFSFNFFTKLSIALLLNVSDSPESSKLERLMIISSKQTAVIINVN